MLFSVVEHVTGAIVHLRFLVFSVPGVHPPPSMFLRYDVHHGPLIVVTTSLLFRSEFPEVNRTDMVFDNYFIWLIKRCVKLSLHVLQFLVNQNPAA